MLSSIQYYFYQTISHPVIKLVYTSVLITLEYIIGGVDVVLIGFLMVQLLDWICGFIMAFRSSTLSRDKMRDGVTKFIFYGIGVSMGHWLDIILFHQAVEFGFKNALMVYLGVTEGLSVLKHMGDFGIPVPKKMITKLENYRDGIMISNH